MPDSVNPIKFVSVRPSVAIDIATRNDLIVTDGRLWAPEPIPTDRDVGFDIQRAIGLFAPFVLEWIQTALPQCQTSRDVRLYNDMLAEEVRTRFGIGEKPGVAYLHELPRVIAFHAGRQAFNRPQLMHDIEDVLREFFPRTITLNDYVYREADNGSHFCIALTDLFDRLYSLYVAKRLYSINLEFVLDAIRALHVVYCLATRPSDENPEYQVSECALQLFGRRTDPDSAAMDQQRLARLMDAIVCVHPVFSYLIAYYRPFNFVRPVGIGDLKVVKQWLCKYEWSEIAHVENVLLGESKKRVHRSLNRTEQTTFTAEEAVEETKKDLETADRYELSKEVESTVQQDLGVELSGSVSGSYGVTQFTVNAGVSYSESSTDSVRSTSNFAKDVVSKAASRIERTVRQERTLKILAETEETNEHGIDNKQGKGHVVGIYLWLQNRYKAQVFNYGKRLMFEILVPEPAAFVQYAIGQNKVSEPGPDKPEKPDKPQIAISTLDQSTIDTYSSVYSLHDLKPEPPITVRQTVTLQQAGLPSTAVHQVVMAVPEGYVAVQANVTAAGVNAANNQLIAFVGGRLYPLWTNASVNGSNFISAAFPAISSQLAASVHASNVHSYSMDIVVSLNRTEAHYRAWQIKTYNRIIKAYEDLLAKYEAAFALYQRQLDTFNARKALEVRGTNPQINDQIIRTELKKHGITMIAREFDTDISDDTVFDAMRLRGTVPTIDIEETRLEGPLVQFLEQAFEWNQLTYLLYPYFWAKQAKWVESQKGYAETDPLFGRFLQAGYARILLPVRPAYEVAVLHFLYTREPWNGGPAPGIYDPLYVSIHDELRHQQDDLEGATAEGTSWDVVLPTSLVYLKKDAVLPDFPC